MSVAAPGSRLRRVAFVVAAVVALGACSGDSEPAASSTTTGTTLSSTTSTTESSGTTSTTEVTIDTTGVEGPAEWVPVVVGVYQRIHDLDVAPNPARVVEVYSENYSGLADEQQTQQFLADNGLHAEGPAPRLIRVEGPTDESGGTLQFTVTVEYSPFQLVRADGSVYQEITDVQGRVQELLRISPSGAGGAYRVLVKETP